MTRPTALSLFAPSEHGAEQALLPPLAATLPEGWLREQAQTWQLWLSREGMASGTS